MYLSPLPGSCHANQPLGPITARIPGSVANGTMLPRAGQIAFVGHVPTGSPPSANRAGTMGNLRGSVARCRLESPVVACGSDDRARSAGACGAEGSGGNAQVGPSGKDGCGSGPESMVSRRSADVTRSRELALERHRRDGLGWQRQDAVRGKCSKIGGALDAGENGSGHVRCCGDLRTMVDPDDLLGELRVR
jgi:hypothetical protein